MKLIFGLLLFVNVLCANEHLKSIYDNVILKNAKEAVTSAIELKKSIASSDTSKSKVNFKALVTAWKKVEGFYFLGDLNDDYLDTPRYIDIFHQGNEDIKVQLDLILASKEEIRFALYKNSHKTINALEYMLFAKDLVDARVKEVAEIIISKIEVNLEEIYAGYIAEEKKFLKDELTANAMMLNALIENSYKLKEWRVGDPAGLSRKFQGKADNTRAEYSISKNSTLAIEAILKAHKMVLSKQDYANFGTMINTYGVKEELQTALKYIDQALQQNKEVKEDDFSEAKPLYKSLKKLHATYYITLIGKLKITAKILDADGD